MLKFILAAFWLTCFTTASLAAEYPTIMVSIKPFYNICAQVMQSVGEPVLLLKNNSSPHDYQLKPSDVQLIQSADLIIWGGSGIDTYLQKSVQNYPNKDLDLSKVKGMRLLPARAHNHDADDDHGHSHVHYDPHFWLAPNNAIVIANAIAVKLAKLDPTHAQQYIANAKSFEQEILKDSEVWQQTLRPMRKKNYIVFHDAYQYFENYFKLQHAEAININPELPPSAKRVAELQKLLRTDHISCIFSEPQFNQKIIQTISGEMQIYTGQLDPLGKDQDLGTQGYPALINNLVKEFAQCTKH